MTLIGNAAVAIGLSVTLFQGWNQSYNAGLQAAHSGHWLEASDDFKNALTDRSGDVGRPDEHWRNGGYYSPVFLRAYCSYRAALEVKDPAKQAGMLRGAADEFEHLSAKGERSRDGYFFLTVIYTKLNDKAKLHEVALREGGRDGKVNWKVDEEIVSTEELSAMSVQIDSQPVAAGSLSQSGNLAPEITATELAAQQNGEHPAGPNVPILDVPHIPDKFALVIGESGDQLGENSVPFAAFDAQTISAGLIENAGYDSANVVTVKNGTASQVLEGAKILASKVPQDGIVAIYYVGPGVCLNGKDYLVGSDAVSLTDPETMAAKSAVYSVFMQHGARIFAFFEVNRPVVNGFFFGSEVPQVGAIAQMEATIPEGSVTSLVNNGHVVGLFAESFSQVLAELRSNRVPIYEFGWQIYNKMRKGNTGNSPGASHQIPTLPVLNNLSADARF